MSQSRMGNTLAVMLTLSLGWAPAAEAVKVEFPMPQFEPSGPRSKGQLYVTNDGKKIAGFQVSVETRRHDSDGTEHNTDGGSDFAIFPKQLLLAPGAERMVAIQWKGPRRLDSERAYRLVIEELPVAVDDPMRSVDDPTSEVHVLTKIRKAIYVGPRSAHAELIAGAARLVIDEQGKPRLQFMLQNRGDAHQLVTELGLEIAPAGPDGRAIAPPTRIVLGSEEMGGKINMLPTDRREISLAWPSEIPQGSVTVSLE